MLRVVALLAAAAAAQRVVSTAYYAPGCLWSCSNFNPIVKYSFVTAGVNSGACASTTPCTAAATCLVSAKIFPRGVAPTSFTAGVVTDASATIAEQFGTAYTPAVRSSAVCASSDSASPRLSYTLTSLAYACNTTATAFGSAVLQFWDDTFMMPSSDWITDSGVLYANFPLAVEPQVKMMLASSGPSIGAATSNSYRSLVIAVSDVGDGTLATTVTIGPNGLSAGFAGLTSGVCSSSGACLNGCYIIPAASYASVWTQFLPALIGFKNVCT